MATNKNQMSIISEEGIKKALETFKSAYKENKDKYEEENIKVEDVVKSSSSFYFSGGNYETLKTNHKRHNCVLRFFP